MFSRPPLDGAGAHQHQWSGTRGNESKRWRVQLRNNPAGDHHEVWSLQWLRPGAQRWALHYCCYSQIIIKVHNKLEASLECCESGTNALFLIFFFNKSNRDHPACCGAWKPTVPPRCESNRCSQRVHQSHDWLLERWPWRTAAILRHCGAAQKELRKVWTKSPNGR